MSVNGQSDQSEASFNIIGSASEASFNFIGNSEIKIEDNGDKLGDTTNMVVDGAASGSDVDNKWWLMVQHQEPMATLWCLL